MSNDHLLRAAHEKLSPSNLDAGLPGRESQCDDLYNFLFERLKKRSMTLSAKKAKIDSGTIANNKSTHLNKTMFICGVPGTGKTATVRLVIDKLDKLLKQKSPEIYPFESVYINGQQLTKPEKIYTEILHKLTNEIANKDRAQEMLERIFIPDNDQSSKLNETKRRSTISRSTKKKPKPASDSFKIIVLDELDLLYNERRQSIFYNLFDWPTNSNSRMILIAIANAMDLPERFMSRITSRVGWNKLVFDSYTSDCLEKILKVRLGQKLLDQTFEKAAVIISTKRIGRTSGDARRILDTCRLAIDMAISEKSPKVTANFISQVGFQNVDTQKADFVNRCHPIQLMILKCIILEMEKVGEDRVETNGLYRQLANMLLKHIPLRDLKIGPDSYKSHLRALSGADIIFLENDKPLLEKRIWLRNSGPIFKDIIRCEKVKL